MGNQLLKEKKTSMKGSRLWGVLLFAVLLLIDQLTKVFADVYFIDVANGESMTVIPGVLEFCISYNRGIAFSGFASAGAVTKLCIICATVVVMAVLTVVYFKVDKRRSMFRLALVLIVAGGIGNFIDRVYYQVWNPATDALIRDGVRDMVRLKLIFDFGVCNFADFFITFGAVFLVLSLLFFDTDALFPVTKKYKALAKENEEKQALKRAQKNQKGNGNG